MHYRLIPLNCYQTQLKRGGTNVYQQDFTYISGQPCNKWGCSLDFSPDWSCFFAIIGSRNLFPCNSRWSCFIPWLRSVVNSWTKLVGGDMGRDFFSHILGPGLLFTKKSRPWIAWLLDRHSLRAIYFFLWFVKCQTDCQPQAIIFSCLVMPLPVTTSRRRESTRGSRPGAKTLLQS